MNLSPCPLSNHVGHLCEAENHQFNQSIRSALATTVLFSMGDRLPPREILRWQQCATFNCKKHDAYLHNGIDAGLIQRGKCCAWVKDDAARGVCEVNRKVGSRDTQIHSFHCDAHHGDIVVCGIEVWNAEDWCLRESSGRVGCGPKLQSGSWRCCSTLRDQTVGEHFGVNTSHLAGQWNSTLAKPYQAIRPIEGTGLVLPTPKVKTWKSTYCSSGVR